MCIRCFQIFLRAQLRWIKLLYCAPRARRVAVIEGAVDGKFCLERRGERTLERVCNQTAKHREELVAPFSSDLPQKNRIIRAFGVPCMRGRCQTSQAPAQRQTGVGQSPSRHRESPCTCPLHQPTVHLRGSEGAHTSTAVCSQMASLRAQGTAGLDASANHATRTAGCASHLRRVTEPCVAPLPVLCG